MFLQLAENMHKLTDCSAINKEEIDVRGFVLLFNFNLSAQITQQIKSQKNLYPMCLQECKQM